MRSNLFYWTVLRACGILLICASLWWDLCVWVCECACQGNLGSPNSFSPYELINVQSCLVCWKLLPLWESSHTMYFLYRPVGCVVLLTINAHHIPLSTILLSTVICGGDNSFHVLSASQGLSSCFEALKQASLITCCCSQTAKWLSRLSGAKCFFTREPGVQGLVVVVVVVSFGRRMLKTVETL